MRIARKIIGMILISVILACAYTLIIPIEGGGGQLTIFSPDGRVLEVEETIAKEYESDGWSQDFNDVTTTVWKETGDTKIVLKARVAKHKSQGWYDNKLDASIRMKSPEGEEMYVFKGEKEKYEGKGWTVVSGEIDTSVPAVALTFDDGPRNNTTGRLLDVLEKYKARATFFMLGQMIEESDNNVKRMKELGMELGSHTYNHSDLSKLDSTEIKDQQEKTNSRIKNSAGSGATLMRPPYGAVNETVKKTIDAPIILWSVDTEDWKSKNVDSICQMVRSHVNDGAIILFHDIYETTIDAAEIIIPELQKKGYQLVTVSELAEMKGVELKDGQVYYEF